MRAAARQSQAEVTLSKCGTCRSSQTFGPFGKPSMVLRRICYIVLTRDSLAVISASADAQVPSLISS
jgi:hypothetical protein